MGQEFIIKSQTLEDKVNQLLPSQGGFQAGVDLSASTTIIPIVDLTESAEGSNLRQDLQSAFSFGSITEFSVNNATTSVITTTGFWRIHGVFTTNCADASTVNASIQLNDGVGAKFCYGFQAGYGFTPGNAILNQSFDFIVKLEAGHSLVISCPTANIRCIGSARQLATLSEELINP